MLVTASLTEYGQRLIAKLIRGKISIADYLRTMGKFALSDDEVVYNVYTPTISLVRQAREVGNIFDSKFHLVTLYETDEGDRRDFMPMIVNVNILYETQYPQNFIIEPQTAYGINRSYTLYIQPNVFTIVDSEDNDVDFYPESGTNLFVAVGRRFVLRSKPFFTESDKISCKAIILGNDEGGIWIFDIVVTPSELTLYEFRYPPQFIGIEDIYITISGYDAAQEAQASEDYPLNTF